MKWIAAGALALATSAALLGWFDPDRYIAIVVGPDTNNPPECVLKYKDPEIKAMSGDDIHWVIVNHCDDPAEIEITNFKTVPPNGNCTNQGTQGNPFNDNATWQFNKSVSGKHQKEEKTHKVKDHKKTTEKTTKYCYEVWIKGPNGSKHDPVIVIEN